MISRFTRGFRSPFLGFRLLVSEPGLWRLATIPFIIALILLSVGFYFGWANIPVLIAGLISGLVSPETFWGALLYYPLLFITMISFAVLLFGLIFLTTNFIAAPFNAILAEKTLVYAGRLQPQQFRLVPWIKNSSKMLTISLVRAFCFVIVGIGLFFIGLIPGLQILAAFAGLLIVSFDVSDFALEGLQKSLIQRFGIYRKHFAEFSGLAAALGLTFAIPGLNLLLYPATVVGASLLVASFEDIRSQEKN